MALKSFPMGDVRIGDIYEHNAFQKEINYLKKLDADRLLRGYCDIGGVAAEAPLYGGWESTDIKGHTLGHYLTAVSQGYAMSGDAELKSIADHIVDVLEKCQSASGYLAAIPESHFDKIETGDTQGTWVPWYNLHKIFSGLLDAYELTGSSKALAVASRLGDWTFSRTSSWTEEVHQTVLGVEYGGMNDCLYRLYLDTRDEKHLSAANAFDEIPLFKAAADGRDILSGLHANTTIPKFVGAVRAYRATGESLYLRAAEGFFDMVLKGHTYVTGGNSEWERFGDPGVLDARRTNCNCETCNTHNMLKLARELFMLTKKKCYADYYETTFINAILSSQNPDTGMTTYFQPMASGYFKTYSTETEHFWCCTGTGMENFSKLSDSIYFTENDDVWVLRYTPSVLDWREKGISIEQNTDLPVHDMARFFFRVPEGEVHAAVVLRVPDWCVSEPTVTVNEETLPVTASDGFIRIERSWQNGDDLTIRLPLAVIAHGLPDSPDVYAFQYGAVLLSADMGKDDMSTGTTGVDVTIPLDNGGTDDTLTVTNGTASDWIENIDSNMQRTFGTMCFVPRGVEPPLNFTPHYMRHDSRYGIYFHIKER